VHPKTGLEPKLELPQVILGTSGFKIVIQILPQNCFSEIGATTFMCLFWKTGKAIVLGYHHMCEHLHIRHRQKHRWVGRPHSHSNIVINGG
jgi:hypothetical protein